MDKKTIKDIDVKGKKVFVRVDYNVPFDENQNITNDTRMVRTLPTAGGNTQVQVVSWYDNENSYTSQMVRHQASGGTSLRAPRQGCEVGC